MVLHCGHDEEYMYRLKEPLKRLLIVVFFLLSLYRERYHGKAVWHIVALTDIASGNEIGKNELISVKCEEDPLESAEATEKSKGCRDERIETVGSDITEGSSKVDQERKESKLSCSENSFVCKVCGKTFRRLSWRPTKFHIEMTDLSNVLNVVRVSSIQPNWRGMSEPFTPIKGLSSVTNVVRDSKLWRTWSLMALCTRKRGRGNALTVESHSRKLKFWRPTRKHTQCRRDFITVTSARKVIRQHPAWSITW